MRAAKAFRLWHGAACLLCLVLTFCYDVKVDNGSEFSGGRITGPLLRAFEYGSLLFLVAAIVAFLPFRRIALALTLVASVLCLPLYLWDLFPGLVRSLLPGPFSIPVAPLIYWDPLSIAGVLALGATGYVAKRNSRLAA